MLFYQDHYEPRLRVMWITPSLSAGGAERWMMTIMKHAVRVKHIGFLVLDGSHLECLDEVKWFPHRVVNSADPWAIKDNAIDLLKAEGWADLIVYWGMGPQTIELANWVDIPLIAVSHAEAYEEAPNKAFAAWVQKLRGGRPTWMASVNKTSAYLFERDWRDQDTVHVIYNGVPVDRCLPCLGREWQRKQWGMPPEAKVLLYNGRFVPEKHPDCVIEALHFLDKREPGIWHAVMHGWGEMRKDLAGMATTLPPSHLNTKSRVIFPRPMFSHMGDMLAGCDVPVFPSQTEAGPLVMLEALMAGKRLVMTDLPIVDELEKKYNNGQPFCQYFERPRQDQPEQWAIRLADACLNPPPNWEKMVAHAQALAMTHWSAAAMVGRWEAFFYRCHQEWMQTGFVNDIYVPRSKTHRLPPIIEPPKGSIDYDSENIAEPGEGKTSSDRVSE